MHPPPACSGGQRRDSDPPTPGEQEHPQPQRRPGPAVKGGKGDLLSGLAQPRKAACARRYQPTAASRSGQPGAPMRSGECGPQRGTPRPPPAAAARRAPPPAVPSVPSRSSMKKDETRAEVEPAFSVASSGIVGKNCGRGSRLRRRLAPWLPAAPRPPLASA